MFIDPSPTPQTEWGSGVALLKGDHIFVYFRARVRRVSFLKMLHFLTLLYFLS